MYGNGADEDGTVVLVVRPSEVLMHDASVQARARESENVVGDDMNVKAGELKAEADDASAFIVEEVSAPTKVLEEGDETELPASPGPTELLTQEGSVQVEVDDTEEDVDEDKSCEEDRLLLRPVSAAIELDEVIFTLGTLVICDARLALFSVPAEALTHKASVQPEIDSTEEAAGSDEACDEVEKLSERTVVMNEVGEVEPTLDVLEETCEATLGLSVIAVDAVVHNESRQVDAEFVEANREVDEISLKSEVIVTELEALELASSITEETC